MRQALRPCDEASLSCSLVVLRPCCAEALWSGALASWSCLCVGDPGPLFLGRGPGQTWVREVYTQLQLGVCACACVYKMHSPRQQKDIGRSP